MEALSNGGVLEGESQIISLIGSDDLSMVEASMLQNDPSVNVMMEFVGEAEEALTAAFSNAFTITSATTTPSRLSSSTSPFTTSSYSTTSSFATTSSSCFTTHLSTQVDREAGVGELTGHQNAQNTPLLLTPQLHHQHHHHANVSQPLHSHAVLHHHHHHHHHQQRPQTSQPGQHSHLPHNYYHHEQVTESAGRSQGGYCTGGGSFPAYISPSTLQPSHTLHDTRQQFLPEIKSESSSVESYISNLKSEPQDDFMDPLETHRDRGATLSPATPVPYSQHLPNIIVGRGIGAVSYGHHGPPPTPSPSGLSTVETNGTPSPVSQYLYPSHTNVPPYLLELSPIHSRHQHQSSQQEQHQSDQLQNQPQQLSPPSHTNGINNYVSTVEESQSIGLGYFESSQLPQEDARQATTRETHMVYLPENQHDFRNKYKVSRKKSSPTSSLIGEDSYEEKPVDSMSNDSDEETLVIDTDPSIIPGEGFEGFECGECGLVCRTRGGLRKHLTTEHLPDEPEPAETIPKQYACTTPMCNFSTMKRDAYDLHIANHIAEGWTPTGKKRQNKNPLQRHRYNKEELTCPLCDYSCTVEKAFRRHLKTHEAGQRGPISKVSCCICGKDRPNEADMKAHMMKHRIGKYYRCDICKFQTVQLKKLIQHRRMHTGEKPHLCPFCPYRAARRDNLRSHVRRMHKRENMYGDTFTPRSVLLAEADCQDNVHHIVEHVDHQQVPGTLITGPPVPGSIITGPPVPGSIITGPPVPGTAIVGPPHAHPPCQPSV